MKHLQILFLALLSLGIQSCHEDFNVQTPAVRSYEQDAEALNKFVDINKTTHEYYINPNKRSSALSYINNADTEELNAVNPVNLDLFKQSIDQLNKLTGQLAAGHGADYIVMMANGETYISRTKSDSPIELESLYANTRGYYPQSVSLKVTDSKEQYSVYGNASIETAIELNPRFYKNAGWSFLVSCEMREAEKKETVTVLFCGVGYTSNPRFEWYAGQRNTEWNFEVISNFNSTHPHIAKLNISYR